MVLSNKLTSTKIWHELNHYQVPGLAALKQSLKGWTSSFFQKIIKKKQFKKSKKN